MNLRELCRDRPLVTRELHPQNAFYGHDEVLRRYTGWSGPLKVAIEHGVFMSDYVWQVDVDTRLPMFLCASPERARKYTAKSPRRARAVPIGPMISYAAALSKAQPSTAKTLVAFPAHSTHHIAAEFDTKSFADLLEREGKRFDRVVVCMYWRDLLAGRDRIYAERGFELTSAGHSYDPEFAFRLVEILRGASAIVTNEVGTCVIYAVTLGVPAWVHKQAIDYRAAYGVFERDTGDLKHPIIVRIGELFAAPRGQVSPKQRAYVEDLVGASCVKSGGELYKLLSEADDMYRERAGVRDRALDAIAQMRYVKKLARRTAAIVIGQPLSTFVTSLQSKGEQRFPPRDRGFSASLASPDRLFCRAG